MPNFIRAVWFNLVSQSKQQGFNAPLTLISKGVVRKCFCFLNFLIKQYTIVV